MEDQKKQPQPRLPLRSRINEFVHLPYVSEVFHALYWTQLLLSAPFLVAGVWGVFLYDLFRGAMGRAPNKGPEGRGAVLITGCDSGFGNKLAIDLAKKEWKVYAGCLTREGVSALSSLGLPSLVAVKMDVTVEDDIQAMVDLIDAREDGQLYCLVNNAGVGSAVLVDWAPMSYFRRVFDINFFGPLATTKACLPLLKRYTAARRLQGIKGGARIVDLTSVAGILPGQSLYTVYAASKHAAESLSNSLRQEVMPFGIEVVTVNPSNHRTPVVDKCNDSITTFYDQLDPVTQKEYGAAYRDELPSASKAFVNSVTWEAHNVSSVLEHVVVAAHGTVQQQYLVGLDARFVLTPVNMLPRRFTNMFVRYMTPFATFTPKAVTDPAVAKMMVEAGKGGEEVKDEKEQV